MVPTSPPPRLHAAHIAWHIFMALDANLTYSESLLSQLSGLIGRAALLTWLCPCSVMEQGVRLWESALCD